MSRTARIVATLVLIFALALVVKVLLLMPQKSVGSIEPNIPAPIQSAPVVAPSPGAAPDTTKR